MQIAMILAIIEKLLIYGPGAVVAIAEAFKQEEKPTVAQIKALTITKDPEEYFHE
jgi:hypothetical protein